MLASSDKSKIATVSLLLVGDDPEELELTRKSLGGQAVDHSVYEVVASLPVEEAIRFLQAPVQNIDAIILDLPTSGLKSLEMFDEIKAHAKYIPMVAVSEDADHGLATQLLRRGAQDFLPKGSLTMEDFVRRSIYFAIERNATHEEVVDLNSALKNKEKELTRVQLQLIQAEKMESLGRMAAGVAHEVKNPLGMLQMGVDFFTQRKDAKDVASELMLRRMGEAIARADRIIRDMVDFSRSSEMELKLDDLNLVLQKALTLTHHDLTRGKVAVTSEFTEPLPAVKIDRMKIEQVLVNLITNAAQAMPEGGQLKVRTYGGEVDSIARDEGMRSMEHLRTGDRVVVAEIRDHGTGIPEEKLRKIFEPFFTTKATGKGTGLGLAVAKTIIQLHSGILSIKNVEPKGVRVRLILRAYGPGDREDTQIFIRDKAT